ncbi:uncharacterized protein LOC114797446 isoform X3 [Denticeps clupeoides]|uniref:uncharacterized protein LOC114797446 isoform X3 n=1 Tax=Denticeps clupeoides TaxID=299321 RepID=UPI0010A3175B|nr:uncharacterized protein LOC114797446 isoform X3 [Denticeps clupeoides]
MDSTFSSCSLSRVDLSSCDEKELDSLRRQLEDAITDTRQTLQETVDERRKAEEEIKMCMDEMGRRMLLQMQTEDGVPEALVDLAATVQQKTKLSQQLQDVLADINRIRESRENLLKVEVDLTSRRPTSRNPRIPAAAAGKHQSSSRSGNALANAAAKTAARSPLLTLIQASAASSIQLTSVA